MIEKSVNGDKVSAENGKGYRIDCEDSQVDEFITQMFSLIHSYVKQQRDPEASKVVKFQFDKDIASHIDFRIQSQPKDLDEIVSLCEKIVENSVHTGHRHFFNQLFSQMDPVALMAELLSAAMNTSIYTFEIAPVFSLMEERLLQHVLGLIGFLKPRKGEEEEEKEGEKKKTRPGGIFAPGGSVANLYGMLCARQRKFPEMKHRGYLTDGCGPLVAFTSELSHYSIKKMGIVMGLGLDNIIAVKTDPNTGRMLVEDLEARIEQALAEGKRPFFVNCTAGTTVMGAYDPMEACADVCAQYGLWMHVDACWGGSAVVSEKHRHLMKGVERADSMAWCFHKMLGVPLQCSAVLVRDEALLEETSSVRAAYLFQQDKVYDPALDTGDKSLQCSRKTDCFKLWLTWKALGSSHIGDRVDRAFDNAKYLRDQVMSRPGFRLVNEPTYTNVCFWYVPEEVEKLKMDAEEEKEVLHRVAPFIKGQMQMQGTVMVGYQPQKDLPNFFRMIFTSSKVTYEDVDFLLDEIEKHGRLFEL
eukprot:Nk52_evm1s1280 gene=Nk52_evmTU1s1280